MNERRSRPNGQRLRSRGNAEAFARLSVSVADHDGYALITVVGEVDITTGSRLRDPLQELIQRDITHHVVDLRGVTFLDSTGLGILVGDHKRLRDRDGSVQVVCGPGLVGRVFQLTAVDRVIPVHETVEAAAAALNQPDNA